MLPLVMVVDDDEATLKLMEELLADEGYQPLLALASDGASHTAVREQPALMILDIRMEAPDSGVRVLREMRANPATATVPVLIFTADRQFLVENEDDLRAQGYTVVAKPFFVDALLDTVRAMTRPARS